jgi:hypothetical protein
MVEPEQAGLEAREEPAPTLEVSNQLPQVGEVVHFRILAPPGGLVQVELLAEAPAAPGPELK